MITKILTKSGGAKKSKTNEKKKVVKKIKTKSKGKAKVAKKTKTKSKGKVVKKKTKSKSKGKKVQKGGAKFENIVTEFIRYYRPYSREKDYYKTSSRKSTRTLMNEWWGGVWFKNDRHSWNDFTMEELDDYKKIYKEIHGENSTEFYDKIKEALISYSTSNPFEVVTYFNNIYVDYIEAKEIAIRMDKWFDKCKHLKIPDNHIFKFGNIEMKPVKDWREVDIYKLLPKNYNDGFPYGGLMRSMMNILMIGLILKKTYKQILIRLKKLK